MAVGSSKSAVVGSGAVRSSVRRFIGSSVRRLLWTEELLSVGFLRLARVVLLEKVKKKKQKAVAVVMVASGRRYVVFFVVAPRGLFSLLVGSVPLATID